jgi:signal peptidase II
MLGLDIVSKQPILASGAMPGTTIMDWGFVRISYVLNENAAFGIGASDPNVSRTIYLIVASLVTIGLVAYLIWKRKGMKLYIRACLVLIVAGALGNMIDRIFYGPLEYADATGLFSGAVVDWIDFYWFWSFNFNIADSCIVVSAFMLIIYIIVTEVKDVIARRKAEEQAEQKTIDTKEQEYDDNNSSDSSDSGDGE